jgi:SEC-C motif-containing protein
MQMPFACPCGRLDIKKQALAYSACCGRYIERGLNAPDAESLMRSRYSAFVQKNADHLLKTWHLSQRPATLTFEPDVKWLGLQGKKHMVIDPHHAEVTFVARQKDRTGRAHRLRECSRFVCEDRCWYYVDGTSL